MIRIITQKQFDALCEIYRDADKQIKEQEKEIKRLKAQNDRLNHLIGAELAADQMIDFPNSDHLEIT